MHNRTKYQTTGGPLVTARARKAVGDFINAASSAREFMEQLPVLQARLWSVGYNDSAAAFAELLKTGDQRQKLYAAGMLVQMAGGQANSITKTQMHEAEQIIFDVLMGTDGYRLTEACGLLLMGGNVPDALLPPLRKLLVQRQATLRVLAACTLSRRESDYLRVHGILIEALRGDDDILAGLAGTALLRMGLSHDEAIRAVSTRLPTLGPDGQGQILISARELGPVVSELFDSVAAILKDRRVDPSLRQFAARAIGSITRGTSRAVPILLDTLQFSDWHVVLGSMEGLELSGNLPESAIERLISLLSHDDEKMRLAAAGGLRIMGSKGVSAIPALIQRLANENCAQVCEFIGEALVAIGPPAIPSLLGFIEGDFGTNTERGMRTLASMGRPAAAALAQRLPMITDERITKVLVVVLGGMGVNAEPAVPILGQILEESMDLETIRYAAMALYHCGPVARPAMQALIHCVAERGGSSDEIGIWAERALWSLREHSLPALREASMSATDKTKDNIDRVIGEIEAAEMDHKSRLKQLDREDLIILFVAVGEILISQGPTSWRRIEQVLEEEIAAGKITAQLSGISSSHIRTNLLQLGTLLETRLTTHSDKRKGGLTESGKTWLLAAQEFLRLEALRRRQP